MIQSNRVGDADPPIILSIGLRRFAARPPANGVEFLRDDRTKTIDRNRSLRQKRASILNLEQSPQTFVVRVQIHLRIRRYRDLLPTLVLFAGSTNCNVQSQGAGHRGFGQQRFVGIGGTVGIGDLNMVGLVPGHHLIA